jgi:hypothetical protein
MSKILISNTPPYFLNLNAPTLAAWENVDHDGRKVWGVRCDHCRAWHWHGAGEGHRLAYCFRPGSPYAGQGYNLAWAGEWARYDGVR